MTGPVATPRPLMDPIPSLVAGALSGLVLVALVAAGVVVGRRWTR